MSDTVIIRGSGGGKGKSGGGSSEDSNTLRSRARARIVELISEGPVHAVAVDGDRSIYFDQTPIRNENDTLNFEGVTFQTRKGLPDQTHFNGVPFIETPNVVEANVRKDEAAPVRTISEQNADAVRVMMRIPQLVKGEDDGDLKKTSVTYAIDLRSSGGLWEEKLQKTITGKCMSPYQIAHRIELPENGYPWDLRIRRITDDSDSVKLQNETWWESYTTLVEGKFTFPHSALVFLDIDAEQFQTNIPDRYYHVWGRKISVPSNYDPFGRTYSGLWEGSFITRWTNNPAWIFYDLVTNDRYGLGEFVDASKVDKWSLYRIAQYCDEKIPSGYTDELGDPILEHRFSFNGVLNTREEAYKVLQSITAAFRGMGYWALGQVFATADMPTDPVKLVTPANVIDGAFTYSGTALKARHSVALVSYNDKEDFYRPATELVIDDEMLHKFGWRATQVQLTGCTSRGQAHRFGKWILDTEHHETETVEYEASWDHAEVRPGDVIAIADPRKAAIRAGGRIASVSADGLDFTLDAAFEPAGGVTYYLMATLPDGQVETRTIMGFFDGNTRVRVDSVFTAEPIVNAMWVIKGSDVNPRQYRVISNSETDTHTFRIMALFHDPTKFARVEQGVILEPINYVRSPRHIDVVQNLTATEVKFIEQGEPRSKVVLSWTPNLLAKAYVVSGTTPEGNEDYGRTRETTIEIPVTSDGLHTFWVSAVSLGGIVAQAAEVTIDVTGWTAEDGPYVSDLLIDSANDSATIFKGRSVSIKWVNNFPSGSTNLGTVEAPDQFSPFYRDNMVSVYDASTNNLLRTERVIGTSFSYNFRKNLKDNAAYSLPPCRSLRFEVVVRDRLGRTSLPASLTLSNVAPPAPTGFSLTHVNGAVLVKVDPSNALDWVGTRVHMSTTSGFTPGASNLVSDGPQTSVSVPAAPSTTQYVKVAHYDRFGTDNLNYTFEQSVIVPNTGTSDTIPPAAPTNFTVVAQGFTFVGLEWTKPADADFSHVEIHQSTTNVLGDAKMVRTPTAENVVITGLTAGQQYWFWARAVDRSGNKSSMIGPVTGTPRGVNEQEINDAAVTASKLANEAVTSLKLVANAVTAAKLAANAVGSAQLQALAVNSSKIADAAVSNTHLAANSVTAGKIAAGAVTAEKILANSVTAVHIAANTITAAQIAANTITAAQIAAASITGEKIAANTITATQIATNSITLKNLVAADFDNLIQNGSFELGAWTPHSDNAGGSGGSWTINSSYSRSGAYSARYSPSGQTSNCLLQLNGTPSDLDAHVRATEGVSFYFEAYTRKQDAGAANQVRARLQFRDAAGGVLGSTNGDLLTPTQSWQRISVTAVAPAGSVSVTPIVMVMNDGNINNVFIDDCYMRRRFGGELIVDGTITGEHINANTISADRIVANSISTDRIAIGGVATPNIAIEAVTESVASTPATVTMATIAGSTQVLVTSVSMTVADNEKVIVLVNSSGSIKANTSNNRLGFSQEVRRGASTVIDSCLVAAHISDLSAGSDTLTVHPSRSISDAPAAGTYNYRVYVMRSASLAAPGSGSLTSSITLIKVKK